METFVIRIWTSQGRNDSEHLRLRGVAEHIGSGEHDTFHDSDELLAFFAARLDAQRQEVRK